MNARCRDLQSLAKCFAEIGSALLVVMLMRPVWQCHMTLSFTKKEEVDCLQDETILNRAALTVNVL